MQQIFEKMLTAERSALIRSPIQTDEKYGPLFGANRSLNKKTLLLKKKLTRWYTGAVYLGVGHEAARAVVRLFNTVAPSKPLA